MTTTTVDSSNKTTGLPGWYRPILIWRVVVASLLAAGLVGVLIRRGIVLDGPLRWSLVVTLLMFFGGSLIAVRDTIRQHHLGRVLAFFIDFLLAVVFSFIAFNRMGMFTGIDAVGEAFNGNVAWIGIVILGWFISGFTERGGSVNESLRSIARWTMAAGVAVLLLAMGLLEGILEFAQRLFVADVLPLALLAVVAVLAARTMWSDSAARFFGTTASEGETMDGLLFVAPNMLGFLAFMAGPLLVSLFISFTEWDGLTDAKFIGFQNYIDLFSDDLFLRSLRNIVVFGIVAIPIAVFPAMLLAHLLNSKLPGMKFFRAVYFLPSIAGVVGVTLIWKQLFNSTVGFINYGILKVTDLFNSIFGSNIEAAQPQWISDDSIALISVIILFVWQQIGFNTVLFLAGMQGINATLYEAADIDGAGPWKKFQKITVPMLKPTTVFVVATTTILALQLFNEPFILQSPSPPSGPGNATLTPVVYLYQNAFQQFQIGYASAIAWALFILIFGVTLLYFRRSGEDGVLSS